MAIVLSEFQNRSLAFHNKGNYTSKINIHYYLRVLVIHNVGGFYVRGIANAKLCPIFTLL